MGMASSKNQHFVPMDKLVRISKRKMEQEAVKGIQAISEKIVNDIISRASSLCKHMELDKIDAAEISSVINRNFDSSFGMKHAHYDRNRQSEHHLEKMAEISK